MWHLQRLWRVSLLLFFISQLLYLSSEPKVSAFRYKPTVQITGDTKVDEEFPPCLFLGRKQGLTQWDFAQTSPKKEWHGILPRGRRVTELAQSKLGFLFSFHKEYEHNVETPLYKTSSIPSIRDKSLIFLFPLILLFKLLNKDIGCSCYQICEKHSVSWISEQLRCWVFQALNTELRGELESHPERPSEFRPASRPSRT